MQPRTLTEAVLIAINAGTGRLRHPFELAREIGRTSGNVLQSLRYLASLGAVEAVALVPGPATHYRITDTGRILANLPRIRTLRYGWDQNRSWRLTRPVVTALLHGREVAPGTFTSGDLNEYRDIPYSTCTMVLSRLHQARLVSRRRNPDDRFFDYRLTPQGRLMAAECATPGLPLDLFPAS